MEPNKGIETGKFYDVVENNIIKTNTPTDELSTLNKIEKMVDKDRFYYSEPKVAEKILNVIKEIRQEYQSKASWFYSYIFDNKKMKDIDGVFCKIENKILVPPQKAFPIIVHENSLEILDLLPINSLHAFSSVNREGKKNADIAIITRAKEAGFNSSNNVEEARKYLNDLFNDIDLFSKSELGKKYIDLKNDGKIDYENTLNHLKNITTEDLFELVSIYGSFENLKNCIQFQEKNRPLPEIKPLLNQELTLKGIEAVHRASFDKFFHLAVDLIIKRGVPINSVLRYTSQTLLERAVQDNNKEIVLTLLKNNADTANGFCYVQSLELAKILLSSGAKLDVLKPLEDSSPLFIAICRDKIEIVNFFFNNGVNINPSERKKLLDYIASFDMAKLLLTNGLKIEREDLISSIHSAEIAKLFFDNGAEINATNINGTTPLHKAVENKNLEVIKFLIKNGAEINAVSSEGNTPFHYLTNSDYKIYEEPSEEIKKIVDLLFESGAKVLDNNKRENILNYYDIRSTSNFAKPSKLNAYIIKKYEELNGEESSL